MSQVFVELYRYNLMLARPLRLKTTTLNRRVGFILRLGNDKIGYGEIAPLPGLSRESLVEAREAAMAWAYFVTKCRARAGGEPEQMAAELPAVPSVLFGADCATLGLANSAGLPFFGGVFSKRRRRVSVNALVTGTSESVLEKAEAACAAGYPAVKVKIGGQSISRDVELVRALSDLLADRASLRLDVNRAWDFDAAIAFARGISGCNLEYIEEPISNPDRLRELVDKTGLPVALDETLAENMHVKGFLNGKEWIKAIVLKPTLLGDTTSVEGIADEALRRGIKPVISACFESGVGIIALANLAASLTEEDIPAGLDTYTWLAEDTLDRRFAVRNGALDLDELDTCMASINLDSMEKIFSA